MSSLFLKEFWRELGDGACCAPPEKMLVWRNRLATGRVRPTGGQDACITASAQMNSRDAFFHRRPLAFCQPLILVQIARCISMENFPASVVEFSGR